MRSASRAVLSVVTALLLVSGCDDDSGIDASGGSSPSVTSETGQGPTSSTESPAEDPVSITSYDAHFTVDAAGDLAVVEALTIDVPVDDRHGIFRTFGPDVRVEDFTATIDGGATPVEDTTENGTRTFRIGDPGRFLEVGDHVVRTSYGVPEVLTGDVAGGQQLDWQLIPGDWQLDISAAELTVVLPAPVVQADCTIGGSQSCDVSRMGSTELRISTGELEDHTPVRLRVAMSEPGAA